jgi:hypothetical protein
LQELLVADLTERGAQFMLDENRDALEYKDVGKKKKEPFIRYCLQPWHLRHPPTLINSLSAINFLLSAAGAVAAHTGYDFLDGKILD